MESAEQRDGEKTTLVEPEDQYVDEEQEAELDHEDSLIWIVLINLSTRCRCALRLGSSPGRETSAQLLAARLLLQSIPTNNEETSLSLILRKQCRLKLMITNIKGGQEMR